MSKEKQIEFIDYEQDRLMFFVNELSLAKRKYDRLFKTFKDAPYMSEGAVFLSDAGREVQFYKDVVEMFDKGYRKQEWISVEERLPEKSRRYLCFCNGYIGVRGFALNLKKIDEYDFYCADYSGWYDYDNEYDYFEVTRVTHWMPLPEPPKMKGGAE